MATEDVLLIPGFNEGLFEYVRTLPPEHNVAIARMDFSMLTPSSRVGSGLVGSDRIADRIESDRVGSRIGSGRVGSRIGSGRVGSDRVGWDRIGSDRVGSDHNLTKC
jgi:hypothetical protein